MVILDHQFQYLNVLFYQNIHQHLYCLDQVIEIIVLYDNFCRSNDRKYCTTLSLDNAGGSGPNRLLLLAFVVVTLFDDGVFIESNNVIVDVNLLQISSYDNQCINVRCTI
ncbi:hypothetical protein DERP_009138 [Dermatophagoides pteronyssinus]|uniref:Uncharacterized protein n=1 Tax=Dermatophagoides pteronyssinus TaxID=6956 RepID=A0ABQ8JRK8_DERPT|nr:hypothetical protein DERP_009138 [Dermatophagoides pteronyssinus]